MRQPEQRCWSQNQSSPKLKSSKPKGALRARPPERRAKPCLRVRTEQPARGPWSAVDALWTDPPASTEQGLHPEKYDACEAPIAVDEATLPGLPGFGRPTATDVLISNHSAGLVSCRSCGQHPVWTIPFLALTCF